MYRLTACDGRTPARPTLGKTGHLSELTTHANPVRKVRQLSSFV